MPQTATAPETEAPMASIRDSFAERLKQQRQGMEREKTDALKSLTAQIAALVEEAGALVELDEFPKAVTELLRSFAAAGGQTVSGLRGHLPAPQARG